MMMSSEKKICEVSNIQQKDTHISKVFLTGPYAYKIKKPVDLEFLDFSTLGKRRHFCRQEVVLNRRLAPETFWDVVAITESKGNFDIAGPGRPVEYAVKMRQLPEDLSTQWLSLVSIALRQYHFLGGNRSNTSRGDSTTF